MFKAVVIKDIPGAVPGYSEISFCFLAVLTEDLQSLNDDRVEPVVFFSRIAGIVHDSDIMRGNGIRDHNSVSVEDPTSCRGDTDSPCHTFLERLCVILAAQDLKIIKASDKGQCQYDGKKRQ